MASVDINVYIIAHKNCFIRVQSARLITYNAGRAPYNVVLGPVRHRPTLSYISYTDASRRPYDMCSRMRKFLKNRPAPGQLSNC